jgi:lipoate-protein ligase B
MHLLLLEHVPPVITIPARRGASNHLIATGSQLRGAGVQVAPTDRGGDITYHGPGQLVAYPILDLNALGLRLHEYMRFLEQAVMDVLDGFGIAAHRVLGATGVWVGGGAAARRDPPAIGRGPQPLAKICAMGVRVSRWVSMHGLALNVTTDLSHFDLIVPCGLAGLGVTSMERELGARCPAMPQVKAALADVMRRHLRLGRPADQSASIASSFRTSSVMSSASG